MSGTVRAFRRLLGLPLAVALVALVGAPGALAAGPDAVVGDAALAYARGLDEFLTQMPEEAERVGLDLATVAELKVASIHHVFALDDRFGDADDNRDLDAARVNSSDLWWVVLDDAKGNARLQVSVTWTGGQAVPEVVGMNWMDADDIQQAFRSSRDPNATLIWVPEDLSVFVAGPESSRNVVPVAGREELERVSGVSGQATSLRDYSKGLHDRLKALVKLPPEEGAAGAGVGGAGSGVLAVAGGGLPPVGLLAATAFLASAAILVVRDRRRAG